MTRSPSDEQGLVLALAGAWTRLEHQLDEALSTIKGISFAEYRMLRHLADAPNGRASRVEVATALGRTPSGVTRALRPLEKLGFVETHKSERDARLALAALTDAGWTLLTDASGVVDDVAATLRQEGNAGSRAGDPLADLLAALADGRSLSRGRRGTR